MPRIAGTDIPDYKKVLYSLRSIFGVGKQISAQVLHQAGVDPDKRARDLTPDEVNRIQRALDSVATEGDLRRIISDNINRLRRIKSYRGTRHAMRLPSRGQRTRSNARTRRGARRTIGAQAKEAVVAKEAAAK